MNILNELKDTTKHPVVLAPLAAVLSSPLAAPILSLGLVGGTAIYVFRQLKSENKSLIKENELLAKDIEELMDEYEYEDDIEPLEETVQSAYQAVNSTVTPAVEQPLNEPLPTAENNGSSTVNSIEKKAIDMPIDEKEMIRRAMSELGKRSAAARARKKEL